MMQRPACPRCGARPRYGLDVHVRRCAPPVSAREVEAAIAARAPGVRILADIPLDAITLDAIGEWLRDDEARVRPLLAMLEAILKEDAPSGPAKSGSTCTSCGRQFKSRVVPHFHARACKGDA